jgi:hypothetical protein
MAFAGQMVGASVPGVAMGAAGLFNPIKGGLLGKSLVAGGRGLAVGGAEGAIAGAGMAEPGRRNVGAATGGVLGMGVLGVGGVLGPSAVALGRQGVRIAAGAGVPGAQALRNRTIAKMAAQEIKGTLANKGITAKEAAEEVARIERGFIVDIDAPFGQQFAGARAAGPLDVAGGPTSRILNREAEEGVRAAHKLRELADLKYIGEPDNVLAARTKLWQTEVRDPTVSRIRRETINVDLDDALPLVGGEVYDDPLRQDIAQELAHTLTKDGHIQLGALRETGELDIVRGWSALQKTMDRMGKGTVHENEVTKAVADILAEELDRVPGFMDMRLAYRQLHEQDAAYRAGKASLGQSVKEITGATTGDGAHATAHGRVEYRRGMLDAYEKAFEEKGVALNNLRSEGRNVTTAFHDRMRMAFADDDIGRVSYERWRDWLEGARKRMASAKYAGGLGPQQVVAGAPEVEVVMTRGPSRVQGILEQFMVDDEAKKLIALEIGDKLTTAKSYEAAMALARRYAREHGIRMTMGGLLSTGLVSSIGKGEGLLSHE